MGWLDDLLTPEVGSSDWLTQELSNLPATDTSGITGGTDFNFWDFLGDDTGNDYDPSSWLEEFDTSTIPEKKDPYSWLDEFDTSTIPEKKDINLDWLDEFDMSTIPDYKGEDYEPWSWLEEFDTSTLPEKKDINLDWLEEFDWSTLPEKKDVPETGPLGGQFGPWLRNLFLGSGEGGGGILGTLLGGGAGGAGGEGAGGGIGSLFGSNPLMAFLMMKSLMKDDKSPGDIIPVGQQAYGAPEAYNMPDYRVTNLKPALMPGVGYANMAQPQQPPPPTGYQAGGVASPAPPPQALAPVPGSPAAQAGWISNEEMLNRGAGGPGIIPQRPSPRQSQMQAYQTGAAPRGGGRGWKEGGITSLSEGPGDVTLAKLEPGEFVMTRKATKNIGARNLYDLMKRAEGRGG
jgi:hypothetical protein